MSARTPIKGKDSARPTAYRTFRRFSILLSLFPASATWVEHSDSRITDLAQTRAILVRLSTASLTGIHPFLIGTFISDI